jgi:hypothetical protein
MYTFFVTIIISVVVFVVFLYMQWNCFKETEMCRDRFNNFFKKDNDYATYTTEINGEDVTQLKQVGVKDSDLNILISEINHYVAKTKGTTDFSVIQNKVERKLNMRYDQSVAKLAFPTHLGLMGTFAGVFLGILMFLMGFDGADNITDESIKNLLSGVLVSMSTSFIGLILTTINNAKAGEARKKIEEDKNAFYDFVQTELMPSLDVSMVLAITRLHETVDRFEPAFNGVIDRFQKTFDTCTRAFGDSFEKNVTAVANAVDVMGRNMEKINENIDLQQQLISTIKSEEFVVGLDKYVDASNHFIGITKSLDKFEEARRMMLAAAQQSIDLQNAYSDSLKIPREIAIRVNQILNRITTFEQSINSLGLSLNNREILGNGVIEVIRDQINSIRKKDKIAQKYFETADGKLEDLFKEQTKLIGELNSRYEKAIVGHVEGFEDLLKRQTDEAKKLHAEFVEQVHQKINVEEFHKDFSNLRKLNDILEQVKRLSQESVKSDELIKSLHDIQADIAKIEITESKSGVIGSLFGGNSANVEEVRSLRSDNKRLQADVENLRKQVDLLLNEKKNALKMPFVSDSIKTEEYSKTDEMQPEEQKKSGWFSFGRHN